MVHFILVSLDETWMGSYGPVWVGLIHYQTFVLFGQRLQPLLVRPGLTFHYILQVFWAFLDLGLVTDLLLHIAPCMCVQMKVNQMTSAEKIK